MTITRNGKKLYPVAKFLKTQHIFDNYYTKCYNRMIDEEYSGDTVDRFNEAEHLYEIACNPHKDGMIYAEYADYKKMKDIIGFYVCSHDGYCA